MFNLQLIYLLLIVLCVMAVEEVGRQDYWRDEGGLLIFRFYLYEVEREIIEMVIRPVFFESYTTMECFVDMM